MISHNRGLIFIAKRRLIILGCLSTDVIVCSNFYRTSAASIASVCTVWRPLMVLMLSARHCVSDHPDKYVSLLWPLLNDKCPGIIDIGRGRQDASGDGERGRKRGDTDRDKRWRKKGRGARQKEGRGRRDTTCTPGWAYRTFILLSTHFLHACATSWWITVIWTCHQQTIFVLMFTLLMIMLKWL